MPNRRDILAGGAGLLAAQALAGRATATAAPSGFPYDYLFVEVKQAVGGRGGQVAPFLDHLRGAGLAAVREAGGEVLGAFTPLIGWSSEQLAVMLRWPVDAAARERAVAEIERHPAVARVERSRLAPTLRPSATDRPLTRGIYTHRWFTIAGRNLDEFVALSGAAWPEFERDFASRIYGLFRADPTPEERRQGHIRMLLNTQYDSHAVWEASRAPSPKSAEAFKRRADMTLTTRVVSLKYVPIG